MQNELKPCPFCGGNAEHMSTSSSWVRCEDCCAELQCQETKEDAVRMWNRRASAAPSEQTLPVRVKALKWRHHDGNYPTWRALAPHFEAVIDRGQARMYGEFPLTINGAMSKEKYDTLEAAQAAAQDNFEQRVDDFLRSALVDVPAVEPEPVGYCLWLTPTKLAGCAKSAKGAFPVYAHPPRSALVNAQADADVVERWQPIETAPKDGTPVDLWCYRGDCGALGYRKGERYADCTFARRSYGTEPFGDPVWNGLNDRYIKVTPTHWMPLPTPPALSSLRPAEVGSASTSIGGNHA